MNNKGYIYREYADLLEGNTDPDLLRLVRDLHTLSTSPHPPANLSTSVERALQEHIHELHAKRKRPMPQGWTQRHRHSPGLPVWRWLPRRFSVAMALILALVALVGAGYSVLSILDQAFWMQPSTRQVLLQDLGKAVDLPQTADGFTMTIKRVYADAYQIVIGYNITGPADRIFRGFSFPVGTTGAVLTDEQGHQFEQMFGAGAGIEGDIGGYVLTYDGASISPDAQELKLRLEVPALQAIQDVSASGPPTADKVECSEDYKNICFVTVYGPFTYNFTVPTAASRVADLDQTVDAGGTAVTLERIVVAPTGTRVFLRGMGPNARVELSVSGTNYELHSSRSSSAVDAVESQWEYVSGSLLDKHGEWILVIKGDPQVTEPSQPPMEDGPWIFRFMVP